MQRIRITPRPTWQTIVESQGFHFHSVDNEPYWDESACYVFRNDEIDHLERATYVLNQMCLQAVEHVLQHDLLNKFQIPPEFHDWVKRSWENDEHTVYARFDFSYAPGGIPKLLEYNADTPTSLLEAAVIQWHWLQDMRPGCDQFNSIHERLIEVWKVQAGKFEGQIYFSALRGNVEDYMTVNYLRDTAIQAGLRTEYLAIEEIAWNSSRQQFVDSHERDIRNIFKLYPWEWMVREQFAPNLRTSKTDWLEPPWKMVLSNKAILPILWQLFPDSPYLLRADFEPIGDTYVRKPLLSREGANISFVHNGNVVYETVGPYEGPYIYQEVCPVPQFDDNYAVIGSWLVNGYACGIGIREDLQPVTQNTARFVPHYIEA